MMYPLCKELSSAILKVPKAELHIHLEGAGSVNIIPTLAKRSGVSLPSHSNINNFLKCKNLGHLWEIFRILRPLWTVPQNLYDVVKSLIDEYSNNNTVYFELRFNIAGAVQRGLSYEEGMCAIHEALNYGKSCYGIESCLIFGFNRNTPETVHWVVERVVEEFSNGRCHGIDINGDEAGCYATKYYPFFKMLADRGIPILAHAGESVREDSILDCLRIPGLKRIGHMVHGPELSDRILKANIGLEMCVTSNIMTKVLKSPKDHPLPVYLKKGIPLSINSDNPLMFGTNIQNEYCLASKLFNLNSDDLIEITRNAIRYGLVCETTQKTLLGQIFP